VNAQSTNFRILARHHPKGCLLSAFLFALLVVTGCQTPSGRDYYFSPAGNDQSNGSAETPFQTLAKASSLSLNPGDRLLLQGGQRFTGTILLNASDAGTPEKPVHIGSYGQGRAIIDAGAGSAISVMNAAGVEIADLVLVGAGAASSRGSGVSFTNTLGSRRKLNHIRVRNVEARGFGKEGIFICGRAADGTASGFTDVLIEDCILRENLHTGIYVTGKWEAEWMKQPHAFAHGNVRVARCLAANNSGDPNSRGENRSGSGILLDSVDGAVIEYCEATGNGALNRSRHGGPVGIWCTISTNVAIQYCKSHKNRTCAGHDGGGFCLDGGVCNSVLQYNLSEDNAGSGFGLYEYPGAPPAFGNAIRYNISRNDGRQNGYAGIHVWDDARSLRDAAIHDNQVFMSAAPTGQKPPRGLWLQSPIRSSSISGNRFVIGSDVRLMDVAGGQMRVVFDKNTYQTPGDTIALEWHGREFTSLREWVKSTGQTATIPDRDGLPRQADLK